MVTRRHALSAWSPNCPCNPASRPCTGMPESRATPCRPCRTSAVGRRGPWTSRNLSGVDTIADLLAVLPAQMRDPVLFAVPFFLVLLIVEWSAARKLEHLEKAQRPPSGAYLAPDSWASISMGLVSLVTTAGWKFLALLGYAAIYTYLAPWHLPATRWYTWMIAILGVDLLYYTYHRMAHRVRLIWATHQSHHSSQYF